LHHIFIMVSDPTNCCVRLPLQLEPGHGYVFLTFGWQFWRLDDMRRTKT
jgi:hypothetical protein